MCWNADRTSRSLVGAIVLCFCVRHVSLKVPLSTLNPAPKTIVEYRQTVRAELLSNQGSKHQEEQLLDASVFAKRKRSGGMPDLNGSNYYIFFIHLYFLEDFMYPDGRTVFGTGWEITDVGTYSVVSKSGFVPGYSAGLAFVPEFKLGLYFCFMIFRICFPNRK